MCFMVPHDVSLENCSSNSSCLHTQVCIMHEKTMYKFPSIVGKMGKNKPVKQRG